MGIIQDTLGDGGLLAHVIPNFRARPQQLEFASKAALALQNNSVLLAECPPGVGKSFGYCVPAIELLHNKPTATRIKIRSTPDGDIEVKEKDRRRVLIVTANIALQEQLIGKDLPLLQRIMPYEFAFKLAKGRSNYICYDFVHSDAAAQVEMFDKDSMLEVRKLIDWARTTQTGDISDLDYVPNKMAWAELTKQPGECKGRKCKSYNSCFVQKAREGIRQSNIIVCNYHLLFTHLAFGTPVIPIYDAVIMDEAHDAVDIARDILGWKLSHYAIRRASAPLRQIDKKDTRTSLLAASKEFWDLLRGYRESQDYHARLKRKNAVDPTFLIKQLKEAAREYTFVAETTVDDDRQVEAMLWADRCTETGAKILEAIEIRDKSCVYFVDVDSRDNVSLNCKTVNISGVLNERLFSKKIPIILTSATLAIRGSMEHLVSDLGIQRLDVEGAIIGSPFDLAKQSMVIIPRDTPSPDNAEAVANIIERCVNAAGGRTLCLFTSYRNLAVTRDRLRERTSWNVLAQGERPRTKLVEEFRKDIKSVLLGVESFWAGIDVPGEALSCLIIDRLPFPTPEDPILDATKDNGGNWFIGYSIPRAVTSFRQGVGRLIRSVHDRGVIVILDDRVVKKQYGIMFMGNFPRRIRISRTTDDIQSFLST